MEANTIVHGMRKVQPVYRAPAAFDTGVVLKIMDLLLTMPVAPVVEVRKKILQAQPLL